MHLIIESNLTGTLIGLISSTANWSVPTCRDLKITAYVDCSKISYWSLSPWKDRMKVGILFHRLSSKRVLSCQGEMQGLDHGLPHEPEQGVLLSFASFFLICFCGGPALMSFSFSFSGLQWLGWTDLHTTSQGLKLECTLQGHWVMRCSRPQVTGRRLLAGLRLQSCDSQFPDGEETHVYGILKNVMHCK